MSNENQQTENIAETTNPVSDDFDNVTSYTRAEENYKADEEDVENANEEEEENKLPVPVPTVEIVDRKTLTSSIAKEFLSAVDNDDTYLSDTSEVSCESTFEPLEFEPPTKFMIDVDDIPRLSEITVEERHSIKESIEPTEKVESVVEETAGKFVDPLTGEIEPSLVELEVQEDIEEESEEAEEEESDFHISEDEELLTLLEKDREEAEIEALLNKETLLVQKDVMELFLEATATKVQIVEPVIDYEALERERNLVLMQNSIKDYLQGLIARIVETCEFIDIKAIMRQNLDKSKLLQEVQNQLSTLKFEQKVHSFLNRKVVDFFKKKKSARVFTADDPETLPSEMARCQLLMERVDALLGEEVTHKKHIADQIENLTICTDELRKSFDGEVFRFEQLVKNAFIREKTSEKFKLFIARQLRLINAKRHEIKDIRLIIRTKQHTFAVLQQKLQSVDKLGDGLEIGDYETLGTKIYELDKKIEEQNNNLNKMRLRCHANLHMLTHMKEKANMMRSGLEHQELILDGLYTEKSQIRKSLWFLKIEHENLRKKTYEYSHLGGLVNKPDLMIDYDVTLSRIEELRARVDKSKRHHEDITRKIQFLRQHDCQ